MTIDRTRRGRTRPHPSRALAALALTAALSGCLPPVTIPPPETSWSTPTAPAAGPTRRAIPASGEHVVAAGETLSQIAWMYGLTTPALARNNGISDVDRLEIGQRLRLRGPARGTTPAPPAEEATAEPLRVVITPPPVAEGDSGEPGSPPDGEAPPLATPQHAPTPALDIDPRTILP